MILEKKQNLVFQSKIRKSIKVVQNRKRKCASRTFLIFLNVYNSKTHLIKALNSLDSFRPYGKLLANREEGGSRE